MATLLMLDGFEHGRAVSGVSGVHDAVSGSPAIVTSPVRTGARALEISAAGAAEYVGYTIAAGNRVCTVAVYVRFASLPGAGNVDLFLFGNAGGNGSLQFNGTSGQFRVTNASSGLDGGPTVAVDTWYRIVAEYDTSGANAVMRATVDGGTEFLVSTARAAADSTTSRLGTQGAATYTCYYDDYLISVTDGDYEDLNTWTGHSVVSLIPDADGTHNITTSGDFDSFTGTAFSNATTTGWTFIDHRPLQVANTANAVIRQELGTTTNYMELTLEDLPAGTDTPVDLRAYGTHVESAAAGASAGQMRILQSDNTERFTTGTIRMIDGTEDPGSTVTIRKRMVERGGGWDRTVVDGLKIRLGFSDNAPDVNFIDCMIEVALKEAAAAGATSLIYPPNPMQALLVR